MSFKTTRLLSGAIFLLLSSVLLIACDQPKNLPAADNKQSKAQQNYISTEIASIKKPEYNAAVINFYGFGPAKFDDNEESVRMSWGRPLKASNPAMGATCYTLSMEPLPSDHKGIIFMIEDAKFVRYDVTDPTLVAPGNIVVGDAADKVMQAHANHIESQPHKYIEGGRILIVTPESPANARLIFEIDASNIVTTWRIGVIPQVYYVEGCS